MKILLIGEYSNLHNSLKKGLLELGHSVTLLAAEDGFKHFDRDLKLKDNNFKFKSRFASKLFKSIFGYYFSFYVKSLRFFQIKKRLTQYDVIQLINEHAIGGVPFFETKQITFLKKYNKSLFLLSCGDDNYSLSFYKSKGAVKYSILTPLELDKKIIDAYESTLRYFKKDYQKLSKVVYNACDGIIASDIDYHLPLQNNPKYLGLIPNPVVLNKLKPIKKQEANTRILLGINTNSYIKKGLKCFEEALTQIEKKYPDVIIKKTKNLPFSEYIEELNKTAILLDQVYGYDQGYNALEAMALGKVVFTGAEQAFLEHYGLKEDEVAINALPDTNYLVEKLSYLIENPDEIERIGKNAKAFVINHHEAKQVAEKYVETWTKAAK